MSHTLPSDNHNLIEVEFSEMCYVPCKLREGRCRDYKYSGEEKGKTIQGRRLRSSPVNRFETIENT